MYALGFDIGSSSVKASIVHTETGQQIASTQFPNQEMAIHAPFPAWAEQDPEMWWLAVCSASKQIIKSANVSPEQISAIGIAYQMHGLVLVDQAHHVLRPSIIWCDSRAVETGHKALNDIGLEHCLNNYLNAPGNFTASKLKWVQTNEAEIYSQAHKMLLPGDYIALKMTGQATTTITGLSEAILWNFKEHQVGNSLLDHFQFANELIPEIVPCMGIQGQLTLEASESLGLKPGIPLTYRAGDQPNNALALGVMHPGEVAATGGTSGVIFGIADQLIADPLSRINSFAHVNHSESNTRIGLLLCINGAGSQYAWLKKQIAAEGSTYNQMNAVQEQIPIGSDGLTILPFGNGAERLFQNQTLGAQIKHLDFNRHSQAHLYRAALEGIAFAFVYGFDVLQTLGMQPEVIKVGNDNLFRSSTFSTTVAILLGVPIHVLDTSGAQGAAWASHCALHNIPLKTRTPSVEKIYEPVSNSEAFQQAYSNWKSDLAQLLHSEQSS